MNVAFDPESGKLSLDRVSFDALLALAGGTEPPTRGLGQLREAGAVQGTSIHPNLRTAVGAASDPTVIGRLEMLNEQGASVAAECWVGGGYATYLVGPPDGQLEVVTTPAPSFPISIARLVGLSPRPRATFQPWRMPMEMVDETFSADVQRRRIARSDIDRSTDDADTRAFADLLERGPWWYWKLAVHWPAAENSDGARSLHIVDTQRGMAIMRLDDERITVDPITPTEVFVLLTAILPADAELAPQALV